MPAAITPTQDLDERRVWWAEWLPIAVGMMVLYGPTFWDLSRGLWTHDEYMHGPIVLAVSVWLFWRERHLLRPGGESRAMPVLGTVLVLLSLGIYVLGRSQEIIIFEVGSLLILLAGLLLAMRGWQTLSKVKFPLLFLVFMLPLPGFIVDALTGPLKQHVSAIAEYLLYAVGYPIARAGVVLVVGPYQLLVADACSGLHSLISMSAMGLLYIFLMGHRGFWRNAILVSTLLPIAFIANVFRVMLLVLVTYHFGDAAGQGFIHDFSGIVLFITGLLLLFAIDSALGRVSRSNAHLATA